MEKPIDRYFQVWSPYYQAAQCNQKTPIPASSRSKKAKKGLASTLITKGCLLIASDKYNVLRKINFPLKSTVAEKDILECAFT